MTDELSKRYGELLAGAYDCVDRIVLNAYFSLGHNPGGFRAWWRRLHDGSEAQLDNTHLMRMAGRFSRRVRAFATAYGIPVIDCGRGDRKHLIAEEYLATHTVGAGVFLILVARAAATVWEVKRSASGVIGNLEKKTAFVNHYSLAHHGPPMGPPHHQDVGASTIWCPGHRKRPRVRRLPGTDGRDRLHEGGQLPHRSGRPAGPGAGRRHLVAARDCRAPAPGLRAVDLLGLPVLGLSLAEQQVRGFRYEYSVYQAEYSRNLLFRSGAQMDRVFNTLVDRTRARLDVPTLRTLFGAKHRPHHDRATGPPTLAVVIETLGGT
jgi:hypothetical protein